MPSKHQVQLGVFTQLLAALVGLIAQKFQISESLRCSGKTEYLPAVVQYTEVIGVRISSNSRPKVRSGICYYFCCTQDATPSQAQFHSICQKNEWTWLYQKRHLRGLFTLWNLGPATYLHLPTRDNVISFANWTTILTHSQSTLAPSAQWHFRDSTVQKKWKYKEES